METPLPIPNRAVKHRSADGTWGATPWESRSPPVFTSKQEIPGPSTGAALFLPSDGPCGACISLSVDPFYSLTLARGPGPGPSGSTQAAVCQLSSIRGGRRASGSFEAGRASLLRASPESRPFRWERLLGPASDPVGLLSRPLLVSRLAPESRSDRTWLRPSQESVREWWSRSRDSFASTYSRPYSPRVANSIRRSAASAALAVSFSMYTNIGS